MTTIIHTPAPKPLATQHARTAPADIDPSDFTTEAAVARDTLGEVTGYLDQLAELPVNSKEHTPLVSDVTSLLSQADEAVDSAVSFSEGLDVDAEMAQARIALTEAVDTWEGLKPDQSVKDAKKAAELTYPHVEDASAALGAALDVFGV